MKKLTDLMEAKHEHPMKRCSFNINGVNINISSCETSEELRKKAEKIIETIRIIYPNVRNIDISI